MKIKEIKHNHSLTDLLKVLLFSILMLLPFLDVGTRCAYVIANKNAYQSYYGETINEKIETFVEFSELETNHNYTFKQQQYTTTENGSNVYLYFTDFNLLEGQPSAVGNPTFTINECNNMLIYMNVANKITYEFYVDTNRNQYYSFPVLTTSGDFRYIEFSYTYLGYSNQSTNLNYFNSNYDVSYNKDSFLDNVFEYSVSQLEESNLYNWTTQTAIYSGVSQMTTQLGITGNIIPIILCYWFFITIIYIILDIVIKLFTILTHFIGSKTSS